MSININKQGIIKAPGNVKENIVPNTSYEIRSYTYPSADTYSDRFSATTIIIPSASQYILSFFAKSTVDGDKVRAHWYSPNTTTKCETNQGVVTTASDGNIDFTLSTEWKQYWCIYTQSSTTAVKHLIFPRMFGANRSEAAKGTGTVSVKCVKLEEGNIATPWIPASTDASFVSNNCGFTELGENEKKIGKECLSFNELIEI